MEELSNYPGLNRRSNKWTVRKRVPIDITDMYKSETISRSLKTENLEEAKKRYHIVMLELESEFDQKRKAKKHQADNDQLSKFSPASLLGLAFEWYKECHDKLTKVQEHNIVTQYSAEDIAIHLDEARIENQKYVDALQQNDYEVIYATAQTWLNNKQISFNTASKSYSLFCHYLVKAIRFSIENDIQELTGHSVTQTVPPIFADIQHTPLSTAVGQPAPMPLTDLLDKFLNQAERKKITNKSNEHYRIIVHRLNDFANKPLYIHEVTRSFLENYRDALSLYPSRAHIEYKGKSFHKVLELSKNVDTQRMGVKSINTHIHALHALFEYAELNDYISKNPVRKLTLSDEVADKDKRDPWPVSKLNQIFTMPLFTNAADKKFKSSKYDKALYWFCLISLWAGMSKKEISQLQPNDLQEEDGVLYLDVVNRPEFNAKLKNAYRARRIPVHHELIKLGLPAFFKSRADKTWLFYELDNTSKNGRSHYIGKRFSDLTKKYGIKLDKCSFHSFRHNYRDALRETEMNKDIQYALGGWSSGEKKNVADNYGSGYSLSKLNENLQKIGYKGLDLSHLHNK